MSALLAVKSNPKILRIQSFHCADPKADFSKSVGELIEDAHFGLVDPHVTMPGYFRSFRTKLSKNLLALTFDQPMNYDAVITALDSPEVMMRPAELAELVALAICYSEEQVHGSQILGLGSVAQQLEGRFVPGLSWSKELSRSLVPYGCGQDRKWPASCRFAAVSLKE